MDKGKKSCECSPSERIDKNSATLKIKWKHLISKGETCPRCGSTEEEIKKAVLILKQSFAPLEIKVILEKEQLSVTEFKKDPLQSNRIWLNNRLVEDWIGVGLKDQKVCCKPCIIMH
jgi:hypothetical protein